jgi:hypothetical protein
LEFSNHATSQIFNPFIQHCLDAQGNKARRLFIHIEDKLPNLYGVFNRIWYNRAMKKSILFVGMLAIGTAGSGCSLFQSECESVLPVVAQVQALVLDAELALSQVEAMRGQISLTDSQKRTINQALRKSRDALRVAGRTLVLASTACSNPDVKDAFTALADAWADVERIMAQKSQTMLAAWVVPIRTPAAVLLARGVDMEQTE